jgi:hypothetical protein
MVGCRQPFLGHRVRGWSMPINETADSKACSHTEKRALLSSYTPLDPNFYLWISSNIYSECSVFVPCGLGVSCVMATPNSVDVTCTWLAALHNQHNTRHTQKQSDRRHTISQDTVYSYTYTDGYYVC